MSGGPLLEVRGLAKAYGRQPVLTEISFAVAPGELVGVTGENGSGKSTLLKVLAGRLRPDRGAWGGSPPLTSPLSGPYLSTRT